MSPPVLLAGAVLSFALGYAHFNWRLLGEPVLCLLSFLVGVTLVLMARTEQIWVAYAGYFGFRALYQMMITVTRLVKLVPQDFVAVNLRFPIISALRLLLTSLRPTTASCSGSTRFWPCFSRLFLPWSSQTTSDWHCHPGNR